MSRVARTLLAAALACGALAAPASAGIWTPLASGTSEDITAIDYQGGDRLWIATAGGSLLFREGGVLKPAAGAGLPTSIIFNDVAFQPGTNVGLAVGNGDNVWRSVDGGRNWAKLDPKTITNNNCVAVPDTPVDVGDMHAIAWGPNNVVYLGGAGKTVLRSANAGATFTEVNKSPAGCRMNVSVSDMFFFPAAGSRADEKLYFQARQAFGKMHFTADGLQSTAAPRDESINGTETNTNLAVDPTNTNRLWATNQCGFTCLGASVDGAASFDSIATIRNEGSENQVAWHDVEYAGGTVIAAGRAGQIVNSIDGIDFFYNKADGALATKDWAAVGLAGASEAAVGGQGGALVLTTAANTVPDIAKPTGTDRRADDAVRRVRRSRSPRRWQTRPAARASIRPASRGRRQGCPGASGPSATLTFPNAGFFTVRLGFRDLRRQRRRGHRERARSRRRAAAAGRRTIAPVFRLTGRGNAAAARIVGDRVRVRARGTIVPPAGTSVRAACKGKVTLTVKKQRKTLATRTAKLKRKSGRCRFGKTIFIKRSKVGRTTTRLRLKISFKGNAALAGGPGDEDARRQEVGAAAAHRGRYGAPYRPRARPLPSRADPDEENDPWPSRPPSRWTASASRSSSSARSASSTTAPAPPGTMYERANKVLSAGVASSYQLRDPWPIYLERGVGPKVWDVDGNEMWDFHNGFGAMVQGHAHPAIGKALQERYARRHPLRRPDRGRGRRRRGAGPPLGPAAVALHELRLGVDDGRDPDRARLHGPRDDHEDLRLLPRPPRRGDGLDRRRVRQDRRPRQPRLARLRRGHPAGRRRPHGRGPVQRRRRDGAPDRAARRRGPQARLRDHGGGDDEPRDRAARARLPRGGARDHRAPRHRPDLRRGQDRPDDRRRRRDRALGRQARHGHARQGARRRRADRRDRRLRGGLHGRRGRQRLPGRHLQREPARHGRRAREPARGADAGGLRAPRPPQRPHPRRLHRA